MRIALCNEVIRDLDFERQCALAAELGYDGLEIAPFTLTEEPHLINASRRASIRQTARAAGITITGLHWLLIKPEGLSITTDDPNVYARTIKVMRQLIDLCADLGGEVLVHGSPAQRVLPNGSGAAAARKRGEDAFAAIAADATRAGVVYCIEPLPSSETNFINRIDEAAALVERIGSGSVRTMIDTRAAALTESQSIPDLIERWLPTGSIAHIHVNDRNRRAPGQGYDQFVPLFAGLCRAGYNKIVAVEPFDYVPDGPCTAARAIGYIRGILEGSEGPHWGGRT